MSQAASLAPDLGGCAGGQGAVLLALRLGPAAVAGPDFLAYLVFLEAQQESQALVGHRPRLVDGRFANAARVGAGLDWKNKIQWVQ